MDQRDVEAAVAGIYRTSDYVKEQNETKPAGTDQDVREQPWKKYLDEISAFTEGEEDDQICGDRYKVSEGYDDHSS